MLHHMETGGIAVRVGYYPVYTIAMNTNMHKNVRTYNSSTARISVCIIVLYRTTQSWLKLVYPHTVRGYCQHYHITAWVIFFSTHTTVINSKTN